MGYQESLRKAWEGVESAGLRAPQEVRFFTDEFRVDPVARVVLTASGQSPTQTEASGRPCGQPPTQSPGLVDGPGRAFAQAEAPGRPCGQPAKDFVSILVLHYLRKKLEGLPVVSGAWISFKELESGEAYYPAFRRRSIDLVVRKYGADPAAVAAVCARMPSARKTEQGDAGVIVEAFAGVPVQVIVWAGDEEFPPDATILFDRTIGSIFCTEDVAVLAGFVPRYI